MQLRPHTRAAYQVSCSCFWYLAEGLEFVEDSFQRFAYFLAVVLLGQVSEGSRSLLKLTGLGVVVFFGSFEGSMAVLDPSNRQVEHLNRVTSDPEMGLLYCRTERMNLRAGPFISRVL